jgi:endonuclease/exonuclease/phosphatase family metal-dependent hydrolase
MSNLTERQSLTASVALHPQKFNHLRLNTFTSQTSFRESSDSLRLSQLKEALDDAASYAPRVPTLSARHLNFDISEGNAPTLIRQVRFRNVLGESHFDTRPARGLFGGPRSIDWALVSGSVEATLGRIHATINASDHYPISFTLQFS